MNDNMSTPPLNLDVVVNYPAWNELDPTLENFSNAVITLTLAMATLPAPLKDREVDICLVLTDDTEIHTLNRDYRGMDKPTNVLSFANLDADNAEEELSQAAIPFSLGDIVIAWDTMQREALEQNKDFLDHLRHMMVHGTLHLLGYDHITEDQAQIMESLEIEILEKMGVKNPYTDDEFMA